MQTLTVKQEAIQRTLFKNKIDGSFFTVNVYKPYITNSGEKAYYIVGSDYCVFEENILMTAIYKGYFKQGLTNIIACKKTK